MGTWLAKSQLRFVFMASMCDSEYVKTLASFVRWNIILIEGTIKVQVAFPAHIIWKDGQMIPVLGQI